MKTTQFTIIFLSLLTFAFSCKKDKKLEPVPEPVPNAQELITGLKLTFTDSANTSNVITALFSDPDGPGGNAPVKIDTIKLGADKTYSVTAQFLDETKNPVKNMSDEIWEEKNEHQIFYSHTGININTKYLDSDDNSLPVGITTRWRTYSTGNGTSRIVLKHQAGTKNGTEGPGETDADIIFQSKVQ